MSVRTPVVIEAAAKAACAKAQAEGCTCAEVDVRAHRQAEPGPSTVVAAPDGIWSLVIEHDAGCPLLAGRTAT
jgi:hypothetical protein